MHEADLKKQKRGTNRRESIFQYTHVCESIKPSKTMSSRISFLGGSDQQNILDAQNK